MPGMLIVAGSCFLSGALVGWAFGYAAGFLDGRERAKRAATKDLPSRKAM